MGELIIPVFMILISVFFFWESNKLKVMEGLPMSAASFPKVLAVMAICCATILVIRFFSHWKKYCEDGKMKKIDKNLFFMGFVLVAYYFFLDLLGFIISGIFLCAATSMFFQKEKRRLLDTFIMPVVLSFGMYYVFYYLGVFLPTGRLVRAFF